MKKLFFGLNNLAALALIFSYLSPLVHPSTTWFFSIFGLGYPFLLIINLFFMFAWLAIKPRYALLSGLLLVLGFGAITRTIGLHSADPGEGITLMTYNIGKTRIDFHNKGKEKKISRFKSFIQKQKPDIICIQERLPRHLKIYDKIFSGYELHPVDADIGTAIYSRYPIVRTGNIPFNTKSHNATWADIEVRGGKVRVYSLHLSSNRVTNLTDDLREIFDESKYILSKYNEHAQIRVKQLEKVLKHAAKTKHPVIISGDFNDVPQSYVYKMISRQYEDAFMQKGKGLAQTFIGRFIGLRIDYTFVDKHMDILDHKIIKAALSDHYPVMTTFRMDSLQI